MYLPKYHFTGVIEPSTGSSLHIPTTSCVKKIPLKFLLNLSPLLNLCPLFLDNQPEEKGCIYRIYTLNDFTGLGKFPPQAPTC